MTRAWLAAAAVCGFLSVTAGAVAAHLAAEDRTAELLRTSGLYGLVHAAALLAIAAITEGRGRFDPTLIIAGWSFTVGIALFSLSLCALALTNMQWHGLLAPFGGVGLLVGWAGLGMEALRRRR